MQNLIVIRREGFYIKTLPNNFTVIRDWLRANSPLPSYPTHARQAGLTFEKVKPGQDFPTYDKNEDQQSWDQFSNENRPAGEAAETGCA